MGVCRPEGDRKGSWQLLLWDCYGLWKATAPRAGSWWLAEAAITPILRQARSRTQRTIGQSASIQSLQRSRSWDFLLETPFLIQAASMSRLGLTNCIALCDEVTGTEDMGKTVGALIYLYDSLIYLRDTLLITKLVRNGLDKWMKSWMEY